MLFNSNVNLMHMIYKSNVAFDVRIDYKKVPIHKTMLSSKLQAYFLLKSLILIDMFNPIPLAIQKALFHIFFKKFYSNTLQITVTASEVNKLNRTFANIFKQGN